MRRAALLWQVLITMMFNLSSGPVCLDQAQWTKTFWNPEPNSSILLAVFLLFCHSEETVPHWITSYLPCVPLPCLWPLFRQLPWHSCSSQHVKWMFSLEKEEDLSQSSFKPTIAASSLSLYIQHWCFSSGHILINNTLPCVENVSATCPGHYF